MPITVNGVEISEAAIHAEMQHHPAPSRELAHYSATLALVARELLVQEATRLDLAEADEDARIAALIEREVQTLEPDEERQHVEVSATASSTLAALHPVKTALAVGQEGGHTVAVELTPQIPGQLDTTGNVTPVRKLLKFGEAAV